EESPRPREELLLRRRLQGDRGPPRRGALRGGRPLRLRAGGAGGGGAPDPPPRAEVQPPRKDVATLRVPATRRLRGVPAAEGRQGGQGRRPLRRPLRELLRGAPREGGAGRDRPDPALHQAHGSEHAVRSLRARGDRALRRSVRRTDRPRALRRAGPGAEFLPLLPGPAPRSARGTTAEACGAGTLRGGGAPSRSPAGPRGGAGPLPRPPLARGGGSDDPD